MKITCTRKTMLAACQTAQQAASTKDVKPILSNAKAVVTDAACTLMATDMELGVRIDVSGIKVEHPGDAILPLARLISILRESRDDEIMIDADKNRCLVRGDTGRYEMPSEDPSAFPDVPDFDADAYHEITGGQARDLVKRTSFAVAQDVKFTGTAGVLIEATDGELAFVATDGHRLARLPVPATVTGDHGTKDKLAIISTKSLAMLERTIASDDEKVLISLKSSRDVFHEAYFKTSGATIYTRLIEGRWPQYKVLIPGKSSFKVSLNVGDFAAAIRQAAVMTTDESYRVQFEFADKKLRLRASSSHAGQSDVELPLDFLGKYKSSFAPWNITEMLSRLDQDSEVVFEAYGDEKKPATIKQGDYLYIVVPIWMTEDKK